MRILSIFWCSKTLESGLIMYVKERYNLQHVHYSIIFIVLQCEINYQQAQLILCVLRISTIFLLHSLLVWKSWPHFFIHLHYSPHIFISFSVLFPQCPSLLFGHYHRGHQAALTLSVWPTLKWQYYMQLKWLSNKSVTSSPAGRAW